MRIALCSMFLFGVWAFCMERMSKTMQPFALMVFTSIAWFVLQPIEGLVYWRIAKAQGQPFHPTLQTVLWFGAVALTSSVATGLMFITLKRDSQAIATAIPSAYPIIALVLGVLFAGKSFKPTEWAGVVCICVGVLLVSLRR